MLTTDACFGQADDKIPTAVQSVEQFHALSKAAAKTGVPIRLEGVVLYSDGAWGLLWIQDETGILFVPITTETSAPPARMRAIVTGTSKLSNDQIQIGNLRIRAAGKAKLPPPVVLLPQTLRSGADSRVSLAGSVIAADVIDGHGLLVVAFLKRFQVQVIIGECKQANLSRLLGAEVEVAGCCSLQRPHEDSRLVSHQVFVPDIDDVVIFKRGPSDPFASTLLELNQLEQEYAQRRDPRLVRVRGRLLERTSDDILVLEQIAGRSRARVRFEGDLNFAPGSLVEAVGTLWLDKNKSLLLDRAIVREGSVEDDPETAKELPLLETARAVRSLGREQAANKFQVSIEGIVTYYDPKWRVLFVHDGDQGIYVDTKKREYPFRVGDRITVRGITDPGGFAPMIVARRLEKIATAELPTPRDVGLERLLSGGEDSQWVQLRGTVRTAEVSQRNLVITATNTEGEFEAVICGAAGTLKSKPWIGSNLEFTGVCGIKSNLNHQATGVYFHVPNLRFCNFQHVAPPDPFKIAVTPIADMLRFKSPRDASQDAKIVGRVTYSDALGHVVVQDATDGLFLRIKSEEKPAVGETIELLGVPIAGAVAPTLRVSQWRQASEPVSVTVRPIEMEDIRESDLGGKLVSIEANVLRNNVSASIPSLTLQTDGVVFSADFAAASEDEVWSQVAVQSKIRITGVLDVRSDDWGRQQSFRLLCPANTSVSVLQEAPWWTTSHTIALVSLLAVLIVAVLAWGLLLRISLSRHAKRIELELVAKGELTTRYNTLVENAGELIFSVGSSGGFLAVNPATERVFDKPHNQLVEHSIFELLSVESAEVLELLLSRLNADQPNAVLELVTHDEFVLETAIHLATRPGAEAEFQCIARDVSERRKLEAQLRHMQKMDSVGQLAAGVAHDYNNLMTVVRINSELLLQFSDLNDEDNKLVELIHDASGHAASLTQQLLAFSRRQMLSPTVIQPRQLLVEAGGLLDRLLGEEVELVLNIDSHPPSVLADAGMLQQALMNLALNGRDAMSDGGQLEISARKVTFSPEHVLQHAEALPGDFLELAVTDEGCGIAPDELGAIFEPFYTTKEVGKGTGLGLSTVFGIVKQHDGWLDVESTLGKGSRFAIYLPVTSHSVRKSSGHNTSPGMTLVGENAQILVVEDDRSVRLSLTKVLSKAGFRVLQAVNGPEALKVWERSHSEIELVITDMIMPGGMNGRDLARQIRDADPEFPIVYCTGYSSELTNVTSLSDSERLLSKPFETAKLLNVVHELLGHRNHVESASAAEPSETVIP